MKIALITGGARGIGLCTAREFERAGYDLVLVDRDAAALAQAERALTGRVVTRVVDVGDARAVEQLARDVGPVDVLVNNAGIAYTGELATTPLATWRNIMAVNFWGPLHLVDAFLPSMIARGAGSIVNVSSGQAFLRMPGWGAYATSKVALGGFSEILHYELAGSGVRVSTIYPFLVKGTHLYDDTKIKSLRARLSMDLMMRLADSPEKTARRIFAAAQSGRSNDRVSFFDELGYYGQLVPPLARLWGASMAWLFRARPGRRGFRIDEVMEGEHEFEPGSGLPGRHPMRFRATWGPDDVAAWLAAPSQPLPLEGRVTVGGLVEDAPMAGTLELRYGEGRIRYTFDFGRYRYIGEKVNIRPWNLPTSHTTCFGRLTEAETGRLVSTSVLHFRLSRLPSFLASLRQREASDASRSTASSSSSTIEAITSRVART